MPNDMENGSERSAAGCIFLPDMTVAQRRELLYQKHITGAGLARDLGVSSVTVHLVIHGKRRSPKVEAAIARKLGMPVAKVFDPAPVKRKR